MRQVMMTVTALVAFGAMVATAPAENQPPSSPTVSHPVKKRAVSQTARPSQTIGAARSTCSGLKSACLASSLEPVDWAHLVVAGCDMAPGTPGYTQPLAGDARPSCEKLCNFKWEQCMKSGFWEGALIHRPAERR
jgi:hypothetical protein